MLAVHCARGYFGLEKNVGCRVQAICWLAENALRRARVQPCHNCKRLRRAMSLREGYDFILDPAADIVRSDAVSSDSFQRPKEDGLSARIRKSVLIGSSRLFA